MFRNMKLGTKIGAGFGLLIAIAVILGLVAVWSMKGVEGDSLKLSEEYAPEALLASELERRVYRTMYAIRGYGYTGEKRFLDEGLEAIAQVKDTMVRLEALADRAIHLVRLKDSLGQASQAMAEYERLTTETGTKINELERIAEEMVKVANVYMENAEAFLQGQNTAMEAEIRRDATHSALNERLLKIGLVNDLIDLGNQARIANLYARANRDNRYMTEGIQSIFPEIEKKGQELGQITHQAANKQELNAILTAARQYRAAMQRYLDLSLELDQLNAGRVVAGDRALNVARGLMRAAGDETAQIATEASASLSRAATVMIIGLIVALLAGVLLAYFIARSITKPIHRIIEGLNNGAEQVASASTQVSSASQSLAEGASEQAAAIEETSSSLEEMSSMTKQNAENANQARTKMAEAREIVSKVNRHMDDMSAAIKEITKSSEETGKIIKTIDEIAFQTNLLALNAAVEAARAGEAGAGFAVVADEVRNLAMRAADAAKNTADLIEKTIKSVKTGNDLTEATQEAYQANVEISAKVGELVDEIAAASEEQAQGIDQINKAVTEMDKVTQQNAANAEESASASEEMNAQADEMQAMVHELVTMVGGASDGGHGVTRAQSKRPVHRMIQKAPARTKALTTAKTHAPAASKREVRPDQVIPFGDDELKNF